MRYWGWQRITLIALIAVLVLGAVAGGLLWWRSESRQKSAQRYRTKTASEWTGLAGRMSAVTASLAKVSSPEDLAVVARDASAMKSEVERIAGERKKDGAPAGYEEVAQKETQALESLDRYLTLLVELASSGDGPQVLESRAAIEDRARQAQDRVTSFMTAAPWLNAKLPGDFYHAGAGLQAAFQPVDPALEAEAQAVFDTAKTFIEADIYRQDYDLLWSMLSNRLHEGFQFFNVTKDRLMEGWTKAWGSKRPVSYYLSRAQISFSDPDHATVKVIAYVERGDPKIEEVRLVKEGGVWRIDSYPFVGWL